MYWITATGNERELQWSTEDSEDAGTYTITINAKNSDGATLATGSYVLTVSVNCSPDYLRIITPTVSDQVYTVHDPQVSYEVAEFGTTESACALTYEIQYDSDQTWL